MTKHLIARELGRQLPLAAGAALLVVLLVAAGSLPPEWLPDEYKALVFTTYLVLPGLLAVATVAPDTSSGALAFLARLPLGAGRTFAAKAVVAAFASALLVAFESATTGLLPWSVPGAGLPFVWTWSAFSFAAGLIASVVAPRPLTAVLLAPILALGAVMAQLLFGDRVLGIWYPSDSGLVASGLILAVPFTVAAFAGFVRGERFRSSTLPGKVALGTLVLTSIPLAGGACVAQALTVSRVGPDLLARCATLSRDGRRLAVTLSARTWAGLEERIAIVERPSGETWLVPLRNVFDPRFSPDGERLIVQQRNEAAWFVADAVRRTVRRLDVPPREAVIPASEPRPEWVPLADRSWSVSGWDWGPRATVEGVAPHDAAVSPSGQRAVVRRDGTFVVRDLATGREVALGGHEDPHVWGYLDRSTWWSPRETSVALHLDDDRLAVFDVATGGRLAIEPVERERTEEMLYGLYHAPPLWSEDEMVVFDPAAGVTLDLEKHEARPLPQAFVATVRPGVVIPLGRPLCLLEGERVLDRPLESR